MKILADLFVGFEDVLSLERDRHPKESEKLNGDTREFFRLHVNSLPSFELQALSRRQLRRKLHSRSFGSYRRVIALDATGPTSDRGESVGRSMVVLTITKRFWGKRGKIRPGANYWTGGKRL